MSDKENIVSDVTESSAEEVSAVQSPAADVSEAAEDTASIAVTDAETEEEPSGPESYIVSPDGIALTASAPRSKGENPILHFVKSMLGLGQKGDMVPGGKRSATTPTSRVRTSSTPSLRPSSPPSRSCRAWTPKRSPSSCLR